MGDSANGCAPSLTEGDEQRIRQGYRALFEQHGDGPASLSWRPGSQAVRFAAVYRSFDPLPPQSMLDIGCGFGDLLGFLREKGWMGQYVGVDFMPEFLDTAHLRYGNDPDASFVGGHILKTDLPLKRFDICVAIGLCNNRREAGSRLFIEELVARAVSLARRAVLVDFLSQTSNRRRDDLFFTDPHEALAIGLRHSRRVVLDHSYMPFEFILKIRLDDEITPGLPYFATPS